MGDAGGTGAGGTGETHAQTHAQAQAPSLEFVVAQYREDAGPLVSGLRAAFPEAAVTVYSKGPDPPAGAVPLPNVGREAHTYLHHVVERYGSLAGVTAFVQAGALEHDFKSRGVASLAWILRRRPLEDGCLACGVACPMPPREREFAFARHQGQSDDAPRELAPARPRPFGAWYDAHVGGAFPSFFCPTAIFAVSRGSVLRRPLASYVGLLEQVSHDSAPEAAHYLERAWGGVFGCERVATS